ncbi:MAG: DinB family protein [Robiginitomaculum sp.]|nr:DinB family protein [Robiginitomaculum sp.]
MIDAIKYNLQVGIKLLNTISDAQYTDVSAKPYHSSIGSHMRHILDVFDCIFEGLDGGHIDFTARKRNPLVERSAGVGIAYFEQVLVKLEALKDADFDQIINVSDDLGLGMVTAKYTLAAALIQAHSHAMHHFASLGYIITKLGIDLPDKDFGFNPTTPRDIA